ncbi:MAG: hypothetical protein EHM41_06900 [Chloroflexi bacterium]|nr:MAG: hypothetical protein EHM41_06900 [Chloroflexota bacterium]
MTVPEFPKIQPVEEGVNIESLWGIGYQPFGCRICGQAFLTPPSFTGRTCPNCGKGTLEPQPALLRPEPPEMILPFLKPGSALLPIYQAFTRGVWLHTHDFTPESLTGRAIPVFWPMWLVDTSAEGEWQAEVGYNYEVKSSKESYTGTGWQTHEVVETRVNWQPRMGIVNRRYENISVPALSGHKQLSNQSGEYQITRAIPYNPEKLGSAALQVPDQNPENAWPIAKIAIDRAAGEECSQAAGGQHVRNFRIQAGYHSTHWTQLLLPLYVSYYHDDEGQPHLVYINGQTGKISGVRLASQRKGWQTAGIIAAAALLFFLLGLLGIAATALFPPAGAVGGLLVILAILTGIAAIVPAIWPWQWNRGQLDNEW